MSLVSAACFAGSVGSVHSWVRRDACSWRASCADADLAEPHLGIHDDLLLTGLWTELHVALPPDAPGLKPRRARLSRLDVHGTVDASGGVQRPARAFVWTVTRTSLGADKIRCPTPMVAET